MRELIVRATGDLAIRVTVPLPETLRAAARRIATKGFFVNRDGLEVGPDFDGEWTYCPPSQIVAVQLRQ